MRLRFDDRVDGFAKRRNRVLDATKLRYRQPLQDRAQEVVAERIDLAEHRFPGGGDPDQHDPAIGGDAIALDEPALLEPVDQAGGIGERDVELVGEVAHRRPEIGDDGVGRVAPMGRRFSRRRGDDSSCHTNYISHTNYSVNGNGLCRMQEFRCGSRSRSSLSRG